MSSKKLNPFKDFQSDQIQKSSRKIFTANFSCNLTPVTGTTNEFIFQNIQFTNSNNNNNNNKFRILVGMLDLP